MRRAGFTLVELLVALALAALVLSGAAATFATSADTLARVGEQAERWEREATSRAWLAQAFANVVVSSEQRPAFAGAQRELRFRSSVWVSDGWLEPADVRLSIQGARLMLRLGSRPVMILADSLEGATFDYLLGFGAGTVWRTRYESSIRPPVAVRLRLERSEGGEQSMVFFIGDRG